VIGNVVELQARIRLPIQLPDHTSIEIDCVIDTGFEGFLTLPSTLIDDLDLPYLAKINATLADNSNIEADVYVATIIWQGTERNIAVLSMGIRPLIGTSLLENYHLSIDFCEDGTVLIARANSRPYTV